jgi:hypothetical protein
LARQPDYFVARRIAERAERSKATGRDAPPMRAAGAMAKVPWQLAQDEFGVEVADFFWQFWKVLSRHVQDEMMAQVAGITKEVTKQCAASPQDERLAEA